jgi:hypothetical protein
MEEAGRGRVILDRSSFSLAREGVFHGQEVVLGVGSRFGWEVEWEEDERRMRCPEKVSREEGGGAAADWESTQS